MRKQEHIDHCMTIARRLETVVNGEMCRCEECGEFFELYGFDGGYSVTEEEEEIAVCHCCGHIHEDHPETVDLFEWFEGGIFDVTITASLDAFRECDYSAAKGAKIMIACGGPNIYLNTVSGNVELFWWDESGDYPLDSDVVEALDEFVSVMVGC